MHDFFSVSISASVKLPLLFFFVVVVASTPASHVASFVCYAGPLSWCAAISNVPIFRLLAGAAAALPFSAVAAMSTPFYEGNEGLWVLFGVVVKSSLGASACALLVATSDVREISMAMRSIGMPAVFVDVFAMTCRYVSVLSDEAQRIRIASAARGYSPKWVPQSLFLGFMAGNLFVRSCDRAERILAAMRLRGYDCDFPFEEKHKLKVDEGMCVVFSIFILLAVRFFAG